MPRRLRDFFSRPNSVRPRSPHLDSSSNFEDPSLFDEDDDVVVVSPSSSSDGADVGEDETNTEPLHNPSNASAQSIKSLLLEAKRLLASADELACPNEGHERDSHLYEFSVNVTADDLLKECEFKEISDITQRLKNRLSAEHILSLGCPQLQRERDIFDALLLSHGEELLVSSLGLANVNPVPTLPPDQPTTSSVPLRRGNNSDNENVIDPNIPSTSTSHEISDPPPQESISVSEDSAQSQSSDVSMTAAKEPVSRSSFAKSIKDIRECLSELLGGSSINESKTQNFFQKLERLEAAADTIPSLSCGNSSKDQLSPKNRKRKSSNEAEEEEKESKKQKLTEADSEEEESCPICLEAWSTGGEHRITCLKCGHLFGKSCIEKWVIQAHACPQCKAPAKKSDIRPIFVTKVTAEDTSQRDRAVRLLEEERAGRRQMEQRDKSLQRQLEQQFDHMKQHIIMLQAQLNSKETSFSSSQSASVGNKITIPSATSSSRGKFSLTDRINICPEPSCRVFDFCPEMGVAVVSQKSPNAIFKGFGIKILAREFRQLAYHPLHASIIRDLSFQPGSYDGLLLSASMDKCIMLTSITSKAVVQKYTLDSPVWCCSWNASNTNLFYAGMAQGVVKEFDLRRTDSSVRNIIESGGSPVTSLQYLDNQENPNNPKGLLIGHNQTLTFKEQMEEELVSHRLPYLQAPLMSLSLHSSGKFLTSFRPGSSLPRCTHEVSQLVKVPPSDEDETYSVTAVRLGRWEGGTMQAVISRNSLMSHPEDEAQILALAADHTANKINVWDLQSKQEIQSVGCHNQKILDIKPLKNLPDTFGALTDKDFLVYKWR